MEPQSPFGAKRLHALLGEKIHEFPPYFIERLERKLENLEKNQARSGSGTIHLQLVPDVANDAPIIGITDEKELRNGGRVAVPLRTLQGLAAILEILHSVHLAQQDGDPEGALSEHLVEGLIVSGRALVRLSAEVAGGEL